jgi:hypothetical protein
MRCLIIPRVAVDIVLQPGDPVAHLGDGKELAETEKPV